MSTVEKLDALIDRFAELEHRLASDIEPQTFVKLSRDYAELQPIAQKGRALREAEAELVDIEAMLADPALDQEMRALAGAECALLQRRIEALREEVDLALLPRDTADTHDAILEVRAGTGGDEAALFAGDLFRMYQRYADIHGWKVEIVSANEGEAGGFKEIIAEIGGANVFGRLKFEAGVHRVQRVPTTESGGRIHTSASTVAVLPQAEGLDVEIADRDLRVDLYRASGSGGQHLNTTDSAVRITHLPTGVVVAVQDERSQHKNKAKAMTVLRARLFELERARVAANRSETRRLMVGSGDRSERIRTYNFPQGRVTDHRIGLTLYKLDQVLAGEALDEIVDALIRDHQAKLLAAEAA